MRTWSLVAAVTALFLGITAANAHAFLDRAEPRVGSTVHAAPRQLTLWFTQNLEPAFSSVTVTNASGQRVDAGKPAVSGNSMRVPLHATGSGAYHVSWRVLSVDTHTTEGTFTFNVGP